MTNLLLFAFAPWEDHISAYHSMVRADDFVPIEGLPDTALKETPHLQQVFFFEKSHRKSIYA